MASILTCIISRNHEWSIRRAIRSALSVSKEVFVIDCDSTDKTLEVARQLGVKTFHREESLAFSDCHEWLMFLGGNEELTSELQAEISYIFQGDLQDLYQAYEVNLVTMGRREFALRRLAYSKKFVRIYRKDFFENTFSSKHLYFDERVLNHEPVNQNSIYSLENDMVLRIGISLDYLVDQANFNSSIKVQYSKTRPAPSILQIICSPLKVLLKTYFVERYFIFGFTGFVDSCIAALKEFLFLVKLREECNADRRRG
jgi:glycosyltransferase involved in cell wall biosynthesis